MKTFKLLFFFILAPLCLNHAQQSTLAGRVLDAGNARNLPGAHVLLSYQDSVGNWTDRSAVTDADGSFQFSGIPYGPIKLQSSYVGYDPVRIEVRVDRELVRISLALPVRQVSLAEVVVSSLRKDKPLRESALPFAVIREDEISGLGRPTLAEMVSTRPGISLVRDGIWGTSLNVRGLGENRIIAMIDGNRLETATDLAAALSMIDPADVQQVEVIKGAASALYGSGSLGGVVNIITRKPSFSDEFYLGGSITGGYQTVNNLQTGRLQLEAGNQKWAASLSGNLRDASNTMTPLGVLPNSRFNDRSMMADLGVKLSPSYQLHAGFQHLFAGDVGIPGGLAFPTAAEATYKRATRDLFSLELKHSGDSPDKNWSLKYFYQNIFRDVMVEPNTPPVATPTQRTTPLYFTPMGLHVTQGLSFQTSRSLGEHHSLVAGADIWSRHLTTSRNKYIKTELLNTEGNVVGVNNLVRGEVPIPESRFTSAGIFFHDEISLPGDRLKLQMGGRFDGIFISSLEARDPLFLIVNGNRNDSPPNQRITFPEGKESDLSWSLNAGVLYHLNPASDLSLSLARAYRAASLEERYKYIDLGSKVRVGDPSLDPETGWSADLGWRTWTEKAELGFNAWINRIDGLITEVPGEYIYQLYTGPDTWVYDTLPALVNTNINRGLLAGFDFSWKVMPGNRFFAGGSAGFVYATDLDSKDPLPLIPPFNGEMHTGYNFRNVGQIRLSSVFAADQKRVADGEQATPGYVLLHLYFRTAAIPLGSATVQLQAGLENITDRSYRNHLSTNRGTVDVEPGRNLFVRCSIGF